MDTPAAWQLSWPATNMWQAGGMRNFSWKGGLCSCRVTSQGIYDSYLQT